MARNKKLTTADRLAKFGLLESSASDEIRLPIGFADSDGKVINTARVRASTAGDRKAAAAGKARRTAAHITTAFLSRCVISLGGEKPTAPLLRRMTEPDRNFLIMEIRKQTWPDDHTMIAMSECRHPDCGERTDFTIDLDEVKVIYAEPDWQDGLPTFTEKDDKLGIEVKFHYLLGGDFEDIALKYSQKGRLESNPIAMNDDMMLSMIMEMNGHKVEKEDLEVFSAPIVSFLEDSIAAHQAGPDLSDHGFCSVCGRRVEVQADILDFMLRGQVKKE